MFTVLHGTQEPQAGMLILNTMMEFLINQSPPELSASLGSYNWFVPAILSGSYWIYIEDAANSNINGTSVSFTIPFITVTNPTSAVNWAPSSVHSITWNSGTTSGYVNIKYYDGVSYTSIATDMADSGSYNWVIPAISSGSYWIYIEDAANPNINGTSASFTIPFITVMNPTVQ